MELSVRESFVCMELSVRERGGRARETRSRGMWGVRTFFSSGGLHDDSELVDALLLIVGYGKLKPELEGRQLVCENLHDFVGVIGQLVLGQFQHLILRPVDGNCENPTHPTNHSLLLS